MSGFGPAANPPYYTIGSGVKASNLIDGGGRALAGLIFPATGWTGTGFVIQEGNTSTVLPVYDSSAAAVAITTPASASASIMVKLDPTNYHTMQNTKLVATSAQSSAIIVQPVWCRYNPKG